MSHDDRTSETRESFTAILDRMQLLGDDFTSHPDDHEVIRALAGAPEGGQGPDSSGLDDDYCAQLDLPPGSSYRIGARKLAEILGLGPGPEAD